MSNCHSPTHDRPALKAADVRSGFLVFLIALPLCLGIAHASGFPPVAGVVTAIVGAVAGLFGGSPLTVKGPAAGLIVVSLGAVAELGGGDPVAGYRRALAAGAVAAALQILLALRGVARAGVAVSPSVVHGMLAAIGVIIIAKQVHVAVGVRPEGERTFDLLAEIPRSLAHANPEIVLLGATALLIMAGMPLVRARWARAVPAPLVALAATVPLGLAFHLGSPHDYHFLGRIHHLGPEHLVQIPGTLLGAVALPDFSMVLTAASLKYTVMFALIGTIESTLTVLAVGSMDPRRRAADLDRDLLAVGCGNLAAALLGGLPMISEIVRSKANVDAGAVSRWSNFFHGAFLLLFVALAPGLLQAVPLAVLAAMLVYTGARLASPRELLRVGRIGPDQLALFAITMLVTLATDLLIGVAAGLAAELLLHLRRGVPVGAFLRPRAEALRDGGTLHVRIPRAAVFPALLPLHRTVSGAGGVTRVVIDVRDAAVVDHTFLRRVADLSGQWPITALTFRGLDRLRPVSAHPQATRRRRRRS